MSDGIVYQNKDIEFKLLSDVYKEKSFEAYGLKIPKIKEVLPANLPTVSANEKHMDNLFPRAMSQARAFAHVFDECREGLIPRSFAAPQA